MRLICLRGGGLCAKIFASLLLAAVVLTAAGNNEFDQDDLEAGATVEDAPDIVRSNN